MSEPKIKQGYSFVLDENEESTSHHSGPAIYNVPNPASEFNPDVSPEELSKALSSHCRASIQQLQALGILAK